jgi:hypothetical protein
MPVASGTAAGRRRGWPPPVWLMVAGLALVLLAVWPTPFGAWVQSFVGPGVRWEDAYQALEAAETNIAGSPVEQERLRLAWAHAEGEPPAGLHVGPRIHRPGTLARLRFETYDARGSLLSAWQIRALVPPLPQIGGVEHPRLGWMECPAECRAELERTSGAQLVRSGEPGIGAEWVLRMPVGTSFDLGARPLVTQDILAPEPYRLGLTSRREEGRTVLEPAAMRVMLLEACPARVRVGTLTRLEFHPFAIIPIPRGLRTVHWVQLDECPSLAEPRVAEAAPGAPPAATPGPGVIRAHRDPATGFGSLRIDEDRLLRAGAPVDYLLRAICRYDPAGDRWSAVPWHYVGVPVRLEPRPPGGGPEAARALVDLPREVALYWVQWTEVPPATLAGRLAGSPEVTPVAHEALVTSGPILCNDVDVGPATGGRVPACVPFPDRAQARLVPAPTPACRQTLSRRPSGASPGPAGLSRPT